MIDKLEKYQYASFIQLELVKNHKGKLCMSKIMLQESGISIERKWILDFNSPEFERIKNESGLNKFILFVKQWTEKTNSIGESC